MRSMPSIAVADTEAEALCDKVLSVSVAAYNVERYLAQTLESCVVPSMDKLEVIVVDDGSTDGTAAIAQTYVDRYPKTFRLISKENGGYGSTVNTSLVVARGKYFKLLDGDDWFDPDALERYLGILAGTDADVALNAKRNIAAGDGLTGPCTTADPLSNVPHGDYPVTGICSSCRPGMHSVTFRTDFLRKYGEPLKEHSFYTDLEFVAYPLYHARSVRVDHFPLYCYRLGRDGQSVGFENRIAHLGEYLDIIARLISRYNLSVEEGDNGAFAERCALQMIIEEGTIAYLTQTYIRPASRAICKLRAFDAWLAQNNLDAYREIGERSRQIRVLRKSHFLLASLFRVYNLHCRSR